MFYYSKLSSFIHTLQQKQRTKLELATPLIRHAESIGRPEGDRGRELQIQLQSQITVKLVIGKHSEYSARIICRAPPIVELEIFFFGDPLISTCPSCTYMYIYYPGRDIIVAWLYRVRTVELVHVEDPFSCSAFTSTDRTV